jgi:NADH dehydrogenase
VNRIVILGGGFAGAYCAQALERRLPSGSGQVLLVDRNNYFVFYPLLVEAGTGSLEPRHAVVALRAFLKTSNFLMAEATGVDLSRRMIHCRVSGEEAPREVPFDHLVLALGSVTRLPPVPGLDRHGLEMKSLSDAVQLRDRAIRMLERADATEDPERRRALLHFVVVGGNYTGVEVAGELQVFLRGACRLYRTARRAEIAITLVERTSRILPTLDADLAEYAAVVLRRRGVALRLESTLSEIQADGVIFSDGESLPAHTVVWCAGIQPHPLLARLPFPLTSQGYLTCEPDLRVRGQENVWAIGDCATIPDPGGAPYPPTAQHAVREGAHLALNLARSLKGESLVPFVYSSRGTLVPLGCRTGVAKVLGVKLSGFPAYFLWRLYYWMRMPGWARKFRVALDWTAGLFFSRDVVQLGVHRSPPPPHP